jgi:hypothetical protein
MLIVHPFGFINQSKKQAQIFVCFNLILFVNPPQNNELQILRLSTNSIRLKKQEYFNILNRKIL